MKTTRGGSGQARVEDERLLRGLGRFADDIVLPGQVYGVVVRSPYAAAEVLAIDSLEACALPGVLAVYTAADLAADGIGGLPCVAALPNRDGTPMFAPARPVLAEGRVRHVGDPVAFVVATERRIAKQAADAVKVSYRELPAVANVDAALTPGAPAVWDELADNAALRWATGDEQEAAARMASAAHVTRLRVVNNRVVASPIEPRSASAEYDPDQQSWTLYTATQGGWLLRDLISSAVLKVPSDRLRVVTLDVGGSFGSKIFPYPEHVLVCHAARKLERPVRWTADRSEAFLADVHGRDTVSEAELALDAEHRFTALRVRVAANLGAYASAFAPSVPTVIGTAVLPSVYGIEAIYAEVCGVLTNTVSVDAYRGAGMPENIVVLERLIDAAAGELGLDRVELRRRNLIPSHAMPYRAALGSVYDSGDFPRVLESALARAEWATFPARRRVSESTGSRRGIGLACYLGITGGPPVESAAIRLLPGKVELAVGTQSSGQGHETIFAGLLADRLGIPFDAVAVRQGDTATLTTGGGTGGSRSLYAQGAAIVQAAASLIEQARPLAAQALQAPSAGIVFRDGQFAVLESGRTIGLLSLASVLEVTATADTAAPTFPNGCHVAEVDVDTATGAVTLLRYVAADDVGRVLDERLAEGQIQGGIAQGYGQAMRELACYDGAGQLLAGSFMDYAMPRAADLPALEVAFIQIPATTNPLGSKGAGEAGTLASAAAIVSAVLDALLPEGVKDIEMPLTPMRVWQALERARKGRSGDGRSTC